MSVSVTLEERRQLNGTLEERRQLNAGAVGTDK